MKKETNIEEKNLWNGKEARIEWMRSKGATYMDEVLAMSEEQWQEYKAHIEKVLRIGRDVPATCGIMTFGRKVKREDVFSTVISAK